ncbi:MAG TPA: MmcQ/YjbR family DNA-binding protein [Acidimicrobiia bacterium]|nr:MmcQ/YjbR family DNA-binding protein [Acidimicrobiia bacterium]
MADWQDVGRFVESLPDAHESVGKDGLRSWRVRDRLFVWERPLRTSDRRALGDAAPDGDILAARVPDLEARRALIETEPDVYFTTPHFANYPAVLVKLAAIGGEELRELVIEAWMEQAPQRLVDGYQANRDEV